MNGVLVPRLPLGLYGRITFPEHEQTIAPGRLTVGGWLAHAAELVSELRIRCAERTVGRTTDWLHPPAGAEFPVPTELRPAVVLWRCRTDLRACSAGDVRLDAVVRLAEGQHHILDSVCAMIESGDGPSHARGRITNLHNGMTLPRTLIMVTGRADHPDGPVRAVVVNLNGVPVARVPVAASLPVATPITPWAISDGWRAGIDLTAVRGDTAEVSVDALLPCGRWSLLDQLSVRLVGRGPHL